MIRTRFLAALAVAALAFGATTLNRLNSARGENAGLHLKVNGLAGQLQAVLAAQDELREEAARLTAQLNEATNSTLNLTADQQAQLARHEKLRNEIARLSAETIAKETQLDHLREALNAGHQAQSRTEEANRLAQTQATAFSNETVRLRAAEAGTAARLAAREKELAAKTAELNAKAAELAAANAARQQSETQKTAAEQSAKAIQARLDAAQAENAALKTKLAELTAALAKSTAPAP